MPLPKENRSGRRPGTAAVVLRFFLLPLLAFWATSGCTVALAADLTPAPYRLPVTGGEIANPALAEASGCCGFGFLTARKTVRRWPSNRLWCRVPEVYVKNSEAAERQYLGPGACSIVSRRRVEA